MNPKVKLIDETQNFLDFIDIETNKKFCINKSDFIKVFSRFKDWIRDNTRTNFSSKLFNLMAQADFVNIRKLLTGFPEETIMYLLWYNSESEEKFLKEWERIGGKWKKY